MGASKSTISATVNNTTVAYDTADRRRAWIINLDTQAGRFIPTDRPVILGSARIAFPSAGADYVDMIIPAGHSTHVRIDKHGTSVIFYDGPDGVARLVERIHYVNVRAAAANADGHAVQQRHLDAIQARAAELEERICAIETVRRIDDEPTAEDAHDPLACPVCVERKRTVAFECGHTVCATCTRTLLAHARPCPVCRLEITAPVACSSNKCDAARVYFRVPAPPPTLAAAAAVAAAAATASRHRRISTCPWHSCFPPGRVYAHEHPRRLPLSAGRARMSAGVWRTSASYSASARSLGAPTRPTPGGSVQRVERRRSSRADRSAPMYTSQFSS